MIRTTLGALRRSDSTVRLRALVALVLVAILASACVPRVEEPDVRLAGVRLGGIGLEGGLLYVDLVVTNPNRFALSADGLTYDLEVREPGADSGEWIDLVDGRFDQDFRVGARDSAAVEIPIEFRYAGVGDALGSVLATGSVAYRLRGVVALDDPIRTDVPYGRTGTVSFTSR